MSYKGYSSLAVCLLVAGAAHANQDPGSSTTRSEAPDIPSPLTASLATTPAPLSSPKGIVPDPAAFSPGPSASGQPTPPSAEDNCDSGDCGPAADRLATTSELTPIYRPPVHIGIPAQQALSESYKWAENPKAVPALDSVGRVVFPYSESVPTIVCAPIHVCDIELQAGEVVQGEPTSGIPSAGESRPRYPAARTRRSRTSS